VPLDPRFAGSNLAESNEFSRMIKIHSITSFRGEEKMWAPCCKSLNHVKDLLRYDRDCNMQNSVAISHPVFFLLHYLVSLLQPEL
jgi:hypothetical protein